jgi:hypothetical protein
VRGSGGSNAAMPKRYLGTSATCRTGMVRREYCPLHFCSANIALISCRVNHVPHHECCRKILSTVQDPTAHLMHCYRMPGRGESSSADHVDQSTNLCRIQPLALLSCQSPLAVGVLGRRIGHGLEQRKDGRGDAVAAGDGSRYAVARAAWVDHCW